MSCYCECVLLFVSMASFPLRKFLVKCSCVSTAEKDPCTVGHCGLLRSCDHCATVLMVAQLLCSSIYCCWCSVIVDVFYSCWVHESAVSLINKLCCAASFSTIKLYFLTLQLLSFVERERQRQGGGYMLCELFSCRVAPPQSSCRSSKSSSRSVGLESLVSSCLSSERKREMTEVIIILV